MLIQHIIVCTMAWIVVTGAFLDYQILGMSYSIQHSSVEDAEILYLSCKVVIRNTCDVRIVNKSDYFWHGTLPS